MVLKAMDSDWGNLPNDLLSLVLERLELPSDYLAFSVVCKSWNCVASQSPHQGPGPMLLISNDKEDTWNVYTVKNDKVLDLQLRLPSKRFCGSSKGWLVVVEHNLAVTLMKPSWFEGYEAKRNSIISLPPLRPRRYYHKLEYSVSKATISADPILNADDCIVTVIYGFRCNFAFIRLGKDTNWKYIDDKRFTPLEEAVHVGDKVYCVDHRNRLLSFDSTSESKIRRRHMKNMVRISLQRVSMKTYLVDSNGKGLFIVKRYVEQQGMNYVTYKFEIFEMNFDKHKWIEKETLGDGALFLGDNSSVFVLASKFLGCQPNCIYFNSDWLNLAWIPEDFGVYNIKTRSVSKPYTTTALTLLGRTKRAAIWVVPTSRL